MEARYPAGAEGSFFRSLTDCMRFSPAFLCDPDPKGVQKACQKMAPRQEFRPKGRSNKNVSGDRRRYGLTSPRQVIFVAYTGVAVRLFVVVIVVVVDDDGDDDVDVDVVVAVVVVVSFPFF